MVRLCQALTVCIAILSATGAHADSCRNSLPVEDRQLSKEEVRACLEPRAKAIVALHLLGERDIKWSAYGTIRKKCVGEKTEILSDDPIVWAVQVSSCPNPKVCCGCCVIMDSGVVTAGAPFRPENAEALSMRDANLKLIEREGTLATQEAKRDCAEIEKALRAIPAARIRKSCRSLR